MNDIVNAKDRPLDQQANRIPNVVAAISGLLQPVTLGRVQKQVVDGFVQEVVTTMRTRGARQAFTATQLAIRPEGERAWRWNVLHFPSDIILATDDKILYNGVPFRVMEILDYREYGYMRYNVVEDFRETPS